MTPELLNDLLAPISPEAPAGMDVSFSMDFDTIRQARKGDDPSLSQGEWVTEIRTPKWPVVQSTCEKLLKSHTKDFQVAAWYVDVISRLEGFKGFVFGMSLLDGILERYWEDAHPNIQLDGNDNPDLDERYSKFEWLNRELPMVLRGAAMTSPASGGYSYMKWKESRDLENLGLRDPKAKEQALAEGKLSGEAFDRAAKQSGAPFYQNLCQVLESALEGCAQLQARLDDRFGSQGPDLRNIQKALEECMQLSRQWLGSFPGYGHTAQPGMPLVVPEEPVFQNPSQDPAMPVASYPQAPAAPTATVSAGPIASRREALVRLREVSAYFRTHEPHSPVAPLVERAVRWAEMPLEAWLATVIKDEPVLSQLQDLLGVHEASES